MKRTIAAATVAALFATTALPAFAQITADGNGDSIEINVPDIGGSAETDVDANANVGVNSATGAGTSVGAEAGVATDGGIALNALDASQVTVVAASQVDATIVNQAVSVENNAGLVAAVDDSAAIQSQLNAAGFATSDVIALTADASGSILVIVDDLA